MKLFFDLFPIVAFFIAYKLRGIYAATAVIIAASFLQVAIYWLKNRRFERIHMWTFAIVLVMGGATLILQDPVFIKWKPSIVNWGFAIVFFGSQFIGERPLVHRMMGAALVMPMHLWKMLNLAWVVFFLVCGIANIMVAYWVSENAWVNFKIFGLTACSLVFLLAQIFFLRQYLQPAQEHAAQE